MANGANGQGARRSKSQWLALFEAHERSGLSQLQFCREHQTSTAAFYNARSRYEWTTREGEAVAHADFVSVSAPADDDTRGSDIELSVAADVVLRLRRP